MTFEELIQKHNLKIIDISKRFEIPYRTVQNWKRGEREAPEYVIKLIDRVIELEKTVK